MIDYKNLPKRATRKPPSLLKDFAISALWIAASAVALGYVLWGNCHV